MRDVGSTHEKETGARRVGMGLPPRDPRCVLVVHASGYEVTSV